MNQSTAIGVATQISKSNFIMFPYDYNVVFHSVSVSEGADGICMKAIGVPRKSTYVHGCENSVHELIGYVSKALGFRVVSPKLEVCQMKNEETHAISACTLKLTFKLALKTDSQCFKPCQISLKDVYVRRVDTSRLAHVAGRSWAELEAEIDPDQGNNPGNAANSREAVTPGERPGALNAGKKHKKAKKAKKAKKHRLALSESPPKTMKQVLYERAKLGKNTIPAPSKAAAPKNRASQESAKKGRPSRGREVRSKSRERLARSERSFNSNRDLSLSPPVSPQRLGDYLAGAKPAKAVPAPAPVPKRAKGQKEFTSKEHVCSSSEDDDVSDA